MNETGPKAAVGRAARPVPPTELDEVVLTGRGLRVADVAAVARDGVRARLDPAAADRMRASRAVVERLIEEGARVYGVTTGFGDLADVSIDPRQSAALQRNLLRSHAAGVGPPLPADVVRAMLVLRANALAIGLSGIRPEVVELLLDMLRLDVCPVVPARGSVGASGDLAPLAHLALVAIGEGEAEIDGVRLPGAEALARAGLAPVALEAKEGLALLNGTQMMAAVACLALHDGRILVESADVVGSMSLEAMLGTAAAFDADLLAARPLPGQQRSGERLRAYLSGSELGASHRDDPHRLQDAYSLRCMPQVHGAVLDALDALERTVGLEINAATDNPLVFPASPQHPGGRVISGGNFHGQPLAMALDATKVALAALAAISERRIARLVDAHLSEGLPPFLSPDPGLSSGLMVAQYTAAALVNELQSLAHPASIGTVPTSANQEDHVSMGASAALQLREVLDRAQTVLGIEALSAAQGLDFRAPLRGGRGVAAAHAAVRGEVSRLEADRPPSGDIARVRELVATGRLLRAAQAAADD